MKVAKNDGPILVVDDDEALLIMLQELLEEEGYVVRTAMNGIEGFEQIAESRPALVLLDVNMPLLDGERFMRISRARDIHLPVLIMSSHQEAQQWAAQHGAVGFLVKPLDLPTLLSAIHRLVRA